MGLIKEPLDVDLVVDSRPLTEEEKLAISEFIRIDKMKRSALVLKKLRSKSKSAPTLEEITKEVEIVRAKRYTKEGN